jgi:hypothetical protein
VNGIPVLAAVDWYIEMDLDALCSASPVLYRLSDFRELDGIPRRSVAGEIIGRGDQFLPRGSVGIKEEVERRR